MANNLDPFDVQDEIRKADILIRLLEGVNDQEQVRRIGVATAKRYRELGGQRALYLRHFARKTFLATYLTITAYLLPTLVFVPLGIWLGLLVALDRPTYQYIRYWFITDEVTKLAISASAGIGGLSLVCAVVVGHFLRKVLLANLR